MPQLIPPTVIQRCWIPGMPAQAGQQEQGLQQMRQRTALPLMQMQQAGRLPNQTQTSMRRVACMMP